MRGDPYAGDQYARDGAAGAAWPVPWRSDGDPHAVEWRLRYGPNRDAFAASIVSAYTRLIDPHATMDEAIETLRRARRAMVLFVPATRPPTDARCEAHGLVYVIEGDRLVCPSCEPRDHEATP